MPKITTVNKTQNANGWEFNCTCPAMKYSKSPPSSTLARSAGVHAKITKRNQDGTVHFISWSADTKYIVIFNPNGTQGDMCKHAIACLAILAGPYMVEALGVISTTDAI